MLLWILSGLLCAIWFSDLVFARAFPIVVPCIVLFVVLGLSVYTVVTGSSRTWCSDCVMMGLVEVWRMVNDCRLLIVGMCDRVIGAV